MIAGLFPDREDPAHKLLAAFIGALIATRSGSNRHILLRPGARIPGTKGGLGAASVAAAAVAAVGAFFDRGMSKQKSRKAVAKILSNTGYSLRKGDHGEPLPVTASALRSWEERPDQNPLVAAMSPKNREYIEEQIAARGLTTAAEVVALLADLAPKFLADHIAL